MHAGWELLCKPSSCRSLPSSSSLLQLLSLTRSVTARPQSPQFTQIEEAVSRLEWEPQGRVTELMAVMGQTDTAAVTVWMSVCLSSCLKMQQLWDNRWWDIEEWDEGVRLPPGSPSKLNGDKPLLLCCVGVTVWPAGIAPGRGTRMGNQPRWRLSSLQCRPRRRLLCLCRHHTGHPVPVQSSRQHQTSDDRWSWCSSGVTCQLPVWFTHWTSVCQSHLDFQFFLPFSWKRTFGG